MDKRLLVIKYENEEAADKGWKEMHKLEKQGIVDLEEASLIVKDEDGKVRERKTTELTAGKGAKRGGVVGIIIGLIFVAPIAVGLMGAALGALWGKAKDSGVSEEFMKKVGEEVKPGNAAIFAMVAKDNFDNVVKAMKKYKGELFYTSISPVTQSKLEKALVKEN